MKATFSSAAATTAMAAILLLGQAVPGVAAAGVFRKPAGMKTMPHPNPDKVMNGTFDQLLDHNDTSKGTFKQRYFWDAQFWNGPGSPVFLMNPGEQPADGTQFYVENATLPGLYAEAFGGAVVIIEHRYWGESIPFENLTAETLQYLDLPQSIMDMTYFAKNANISFGTNSTDGLDNSNNADRAPWVLIGGSYPGALAAWTQQLDPGVFWAYHASSAPVQTVTDFWSYFAPVEAALPRNCSADVRAVTSYVNHVLSTGTSEEKTSLKRLFGLGMLDHDDDFANSMTTNTVTAWQEDQTAVAQFCDYLETLGASNDTIVVATDADLAAAAIAPDAAWEGGVGLAAALPLYAAWVNATSGPGCAPPDANSVSTCDYYSNVTALNDPTSTTGPRQWMWLLCHNPFSWWQVADNNNNNDATSPATPATQNPGIIPSALDVASQQRLCPLYFPETNGYVAGAVQGFTAEHLDLYTGGWAPEHPLERVLFVNGEFDPWRAASVSSDQRPGGPMVSTPEVPIFVVPGGVHCPELIIGQFEGALDMYDDILEVMRGWLEEWKAPS